uniref:Uncharacterized protein n=1 Tax=Triticum urartu TaxID=4572 RepID=A0A8R7QEQ0_TRIUA
MQCHGQHKRQAMKKKSVVYGGGKLTLQGALPRSDPVHHQA